MNATAVVEDAVAGLVGLSLEQVNERAALMTRVDRKYFVDAATLAAFFERTEGRFAVLDIEGRRLMGYHSTYFDTADMDTYRDHLKGRRRRYKVRLRTYTDTGTHFLEVKHKGLRAVTRKTRVPYTGDLDLSAPPPVLGDRGHAFVSTIVDGAYRQRLPGRLSPSFSTTNRRATLVSLVDDARVTFDVDVYLTDSSGVAGYANLRSGYAMVETKSGRGASFADRALRELGVRPVKVSKYCAAVALHRRDLPSAPWRRVVRTYFTPVNGHKIKGAVA
ncbi:polyphosphate polymerase domain-containing protein [Nocardioides korecus]